MCARKAFELLIAGTEAPETGRGTDADWDFCSSSNRCKYKEGDCDNDSECVDDHVCGHNNCRDFWNDAVSEADCCLPGDTLVENKTITRHSSIHNPAS